jgi:hypothetical protein
MMMKQTKFLFWFIRIRLPPMITNDSSNSAPSRTDTMNFACHYLFDWYLRYSNHSSVKSMKKFAERSNRYLVHSNSSAGGT